MATQQYYELMEARRKRQRLVKKKRKAAVKRAKAKKAALGKWQPLRSRLPGSGWAGKGQR
jgi:hypothetical protein